MFKIPFFSLGILLFVLLVALIVSGRPNWFGLVILLAISFSLSVLCSKKYSKVVFRVNFDV